MKKNLNANSKRIAGTYGAYSTKVESFNLDGHEFVGITLSTVFISIGSPCAWRTERLVYSREEGVLLKLKEYHKHDASGYVYKLEGYTVVAFGDLTFNEEA